MSIKSTASSDNTRPVACSGASRLSELVLGFWGGGSGWGGGRCFRQKLRRLRISNPPTMITAAARMHPAPHAFCVSSEREGRNGLNSRTMIRRTDTWLLLFFIRFHFVDCPEEGEQQGD